MKAGFSKTWRALLSWPKPPGGTRYAACHFCDTLHEAAPLEEGAAARCTRCGTVLYQNRVASLTRASACSLAALILMALAHVFPFLTMDAATLRKSLTLLGAAVALIDEGTPVLGISIVLFTIVAPFVLAGGMLYVSLPLMFGRLLPGSFTIAKWMHLSEPWNMVEVFLLGVLVSLLKLGQVADVTFGIGFWAFAGLMLCMAFAVAGIDREELWDRMEVARR
jgi:paraquat-inducible protein A